MILAPIAISTRPPTTSNLGPHAAPTRRPSTIPVAVTAAVISPMTSAGTAMGVLSSEASDADRRRHHAARRVFTVEVVLVCGFLVLAHALLDLDWQSHAVWGAIGALAGAGLGVVGCALALSSTLAQREYRRA